MNCFNFSSAMKIIADNRNKSKCRSELKLLTTLFRDYIRTTDYHFVQPTVSLWMNDRRTLPKEIIGYYGKKRNQRLLCETVEKEVLCLFDDPMKVVLALEKALKNADNVSDGKEQELIADTAFETDEDIAMFIVELLCFAMTQPRKEEMQYSFMKSGNCGLQLTEELYNCDVPKPCSWFQGRGNEITALHNKLLKKHHVFLRGIPGIGKSEMAKKYAQKYQEKYAKMFYIFYDGDLRKTITELSFASDVPYETDVVRFRKHSHFLRSLPENVLLIIDNVNNADDPDMSLILDYSCRVLVTTRNHFRHRNEMAVQELDQKSVCQLVEYFFSGYEINQKIVEKMIRVLHSHTFAVELAARLMETGILEPEQLLEKLRTERVAMNSTDEIRAYKDGKGRKTTYYDHIRLLFGLFELTEETRSVMRHMALMPVTGVPCCLFAQWLSMENLNAMNHLVEMGLIQMLSDDQIALHPMIREVSGAEFSASFSSCRGLTDVLYGIFMVQGLEMTYHRWLFQAVEGIMKYAEVDDALMCFKFLEGAFWCMEKYKHDTGMKKVFRKMRELMKDPAVETKKNQALLWQCRSVLEQDPGMVRKCLKKAVGLISEPEEDTAVLLANLHSNLGIGYLKEKDYDMARIHMEQGMRIMETFGVSGTQNTMAQYINYANLLVSHGEAQRGYEMLRCLKNFFEKENRTLCDDYATILFQMGVTLGASGYGDLAKEHLNQALQIYECIFATAPEVLKENRKLVNEALKKIDNQTKQLGS